MKGGEPHEAVGLKKDYRDVFGKNTSIAKAKKNIRHSPFMKRSKRPADY